MPPSDDYLDTYSSFGYPNDGHRMPPKANAEATTSSYSRRSLCLDLVDEVQGITELADLQSRHVSRIIQHTLQRVLDHVTYRGFDLPETNPFADGQVPYLDFFTGDIRVCVNGLLRKYELHSGPRRIGERLLTNDEFTSFVYWIDYIVELGNEGAFEDVPHALSCLNTWVQTL